MLEATLVGFAGLGDLRVTTVDRRGRPIDSTVSIRREGSASWTKYGTRGARVAIRVPRGRYFLTAKGLGTSLVAPEKSVWNGGGDIAVTLGLAPPAPPPPGFRPVTHWPAKCRTVCEGLEGLGQAACTYVDTKAFTQALTTTGYLRYPTAVWDERVERAASSWAERHADFDFGLFGVRFSPLRNAGMVSVCPTEAWGILSAEAAGVAAAGRLTLPPGVVPPSAVAVAPPPISPSAVPRPPAPAPRRRHAEAGIAGPVVVIGLLAFGAWWLGRQ